MMKGVITSIKKTLSNINFKSKKTWLLIGFFLVAVISTTIYSSYSYYEHISSNNLAVGGTAFISDSDIILKVYLEDRDSSGNGTGNYTRQYFIPTANYTYSESSTICSSGIKIKSFNGGIFDIQATKKGYCKVYFAAVDGVTADVTYNLYVEQTDGAGDYELTGRIPDNSYSYTINTSKTNCNPAAVKDALVLNNREIYVSATQNFSCNIYVDINSTITYDLLSSKVVALAGSSGQTYTSGQDGSIYRVINQNGYRYEGADPDNYVMFNGELWRIVGAFEGSTVGLLSGKYYTKIVRDDGLYHSVFTGISGTKNNSFLISPIYKYLNGEYYNSISTSSRKLMVKPYWHLGGVVQSGENSYLPNNFYADERNGSVGAYNASNVLGYADYVGLLHASDYGYAMYTDKSSLCVNGTTTVKKYTDCIPYVWIGEFSRNHSTYEWTLSVIRDNYYTFYISVGKYISDTNSVTDALAVRPVVYLDYDVKIIGGSGSRGNPYRLK